jgi:hypothetical protein
LFDDAIGLAEEGFDVSPRLAGLVAEDAERLARFPATAAYFLPGGQPLKARPPRCEPVIGGDPVQRHEADVVAMPGIGGTGVAETGEKFHATLLPPRPGAVRASTHPTGRRFLVARDGHPRNRAGPA